MTKGNGIPKEILQSKQTKVYKGIYFCTYDNKLEILFKPHYYFNDNLHNANGFTAKDCINTLNTFKNTFELPTKELIILNIEIGINAISPIGCKDLITYSIYHERNQFINSSDNLRYSKISFKHNRNGNANNYKKIKFYAKGLQFPQYANNNTFRFEIKSKRTSYIKSKLNIFTFSDLLVLSNYITFANEIRSEFEKILILDIDNSKENLTPKEQIKLNEYNNPIYWNKSINKSRNVFNTDKTKYNKLLSKTNNSLKEKMTTIVNNKLNELTKGCAILTPQKETKKCAVLNVYIMENCTPKQIKKCLVTGLDISMQKEDSKFIQKVGLRLLFIDNNIKYRELEKKYLSKKWINVKFDKQIIELSHNIRNEYFNQKYKQKRKYRVSQKDLLNVFFLKTSSSCKITFV
jgi:hypothetical protein